MIGSGEAMKRLDRPTVVFLVLAALWGVAQFVLAFFVHVTERAHETSAGWAVPPTKTYMQAFGVSEAILTILSLGVVVLVAGALYRRRMRNERGAGRLAWGISIATAVLGVVGFVYLFGVAVCLLLACGTVPRHAAPTVGRARPTVGSGATG